MKLIPRDVYDKNGDMVKIEFLNDEGEIEIEAVWDEQDPNDEEHRVAFRKWAYRFVSQTTGKKIE